MLGVMVVKICKFRSIIAITKFFYNCAISNNFVLIIIKTKYLGYGLYHHEKGIFGNLVSMLKFVKFRECLFKKLLKFVKFVC